MSAVCPAGHDSTAEDYCDVCGLPIPDAAATPAAGTLGGAGAAGGGGVSPADVAATAPAEEAATCPNCSAANPPNALFCEACGYDFTTGTLPRPVTPSPLNLSDFQTGPAAAAEAGPADDAGDADDADDTAARPAPVVSAAPAVAPPLAEPWVAEVWIDPDWYAAQDSDDPLPSAGLPQVIAIASTSVLIGRESRSRGIHPDIDLGSDNGISRRHCQLSTDGRRWWVEDLGSSNGTYVGSSVGALPQQPLRPGDKREIAPDERIYLGAWTRIVIRRAQPGEV